MSGHGRPPSKEPKRNDMRLRLSDVERDKLEFCSNTTGMSKSDIIRIGIDKVYEELKKEHD